MAWQNYPFLFPLLFSGSLTIAIGMIAWRRRKQAATARSMAVMMLGGSIWAFTNAGILFVQSYDSWLLWSFANYIGIVLIPAGWLVYACQVTGKDRWITRNRLLLYAIEPVVVLILILTNEYHHLFYTGYSHEFNGLFTVIRGTYGLFFWIHAAYSNVVLLIGLLLLLIAMVRQRSMYRSQYLTVLIGVLIPWISNFLFLFRVFPWGNIDLTPMFFTVTGILFFWALFRYQLFELSPIARDRLIEVMSDAVLVIDTHERVVDLNPAFEHMVRLPARKIVGRSIKEILGDWLDTIGQPDEHCLTWETVFQVPAVDSHLAGRYYHLQLNRVFNRSKQPIGWLAVVRDVTEQKEVERENLRLYQVEHEGRLMAEVMNQASQILSATLDLDTLLDRLLEEVERIVPYDSANVFLIEGDEAVIARSRGFEKYGIDARDLRIIRFKLETTGNFRLMMEHKRAMAIGDTHSDPNWTVVPATCYIRSWIGAPLIARDKVIGFFSMDKEQKNFYQPVHVERLMAFANHAALAINNAQLYQAAQHRAEEAEALRAATAAVTSALDLDQVLERILVHLKQVVPYDSAAIFLLDGDMLRVQAGHGFAHPERVINCLFPADDALFNEARQTNHGVIIQDVRKEPRFQRYGDSDHVRSWMGVPLQTRGEIIGFLTVDSHMVGTYHDAHLALAQALANEAATAIENARLFAEVQRLAITDPLTGLYNRRHFYTLARQEFERSVRYGSPLSLIMLDADDLKMVNDHYGHLAGDQMLELVAQKCQEVLRSVDILGRYAGDEFVILLPETSRQGAFAAAERLRQNIVTATLPAWNGKFHASISIGIAELTPDCQSVETLIERADQALYLSKRNGKNNVTLWRDNLFAQLQGIDWNA